MRIQNQTQINYKMLSAKSFTANWKEVKDDSGRFLYRTSSYFFRKDLPWHEFVDMLVQKYKDISKVNIYCYACSDGSEPFSLAMLLIKKLGKKKAQKFFPIIASDIDEEILKNPKRGIIRLSQSEISHINANMNGNYSRFLMNDDKFEYDSELKDFLCTGNVKPILKNAIKFKNIDIIKDISNIERDNSVVLCRNFWAYLPKEERPKLAKNLFDRLGNNSMCVVGEYEDHYDNFDCFAKDCLINEGFEPSDINNCFIKASKEKKHLNDPNFLMANFANKK